MEVEVDCRDETEAVQKVKRAWNKEQREQVEGNCQETVDETGDEEKELLNELVGGIWKEGLEGVWEEVRHDLNEGVGECKRLKK